MGSKSRHISKRELGVLSRYKANAGPVVTRKVGEPKEPYPERFPTYDPSPKRHNKR